MRPSCIDPAGELACQEGDATPAVDRQRGRMRAPPAGAGVEASAAVTEAAAMARQQSQHPPWALTDLPAKQPITPSDVSAAARPMLRPTYQSRVSLSPASAVKDRHRHQQQRQQQRLQLSIQPTRLLALEPGYDDGGNEDGDGMLSLPPSRSPAGRPGSRASVAWRLPNENGMEEEEEDVELALDGVLLLPSQQPEQRLVRYGVPSDSEDEDEGMEGEAVIVAGHWDGGNNYQNGSPPPLTAAAGGAGGGAGGFLPLAAGGVDDEDGGMDLEEEEEAEAGVGALEGRGGGDGGADSDAALAASRLRAALKEAGAAAAAEFEEGFDRACQQEERGRRRRGDQPLMGDGDGGRRVEEEEERRVREDRQRMFALLATELQQREATEAAWEAIRRALAAPSIHLPQLAQLLEAEPLQRARAAGEEEAENEAEREARGLLQAAAQMEAAITTPMEQWAVAVDRHSGREQSGLEMRAAAEAVLQAVQALPPPLTALLPRLDPGNERSPRFAAMARLRREWRELEAAARYEEPVTPPPPAPSAPPAAAPAATAAAAVVVGAAGGAAGAGTTAAGPDPLQEARASVGRWKALVAALGGEERVMADVKRHEDALSNYLSHLKTTRQSLGVVMRQGRLQSDSQPSLLEYLRTGGSTANAHAAQQGRVDLPQRLLAYRAFFRAVIGEGGKGPLCRNDKCGRKGVAELWIVMYAQMLLAPAVLFPETLPLPSSPSSPHAAVSMSDVLWASFHDACPSAIPDPSDGQSLRLSDEARASIEGDVGKRLSTVTFQNQFNVSSKDYWYLKKPARALRLLAQMMLTLATPYNALRFQRTLEAWAGPQLLQQAMTAPLRLPFDGDSLWGWLVSYLKALIRKHEAKTGILLPDLLLLSSFLAHDLPCAFLDLGPDGSSNNSTTRFGGGGRGGRGGDSTTDPWSHFKDEWDKDYLNEHEPMGGVLSTLLEKHGAPRLALLCKLIMSEGYGRPLAWYLQHRGQLKEQFQPWEMAAGRSIGYNVDDLLPDNLPPPPRTGVPPRIPCFCLTPGCHEPAQFFDPGLQPLPVPAYCARHKPASALDRYQGMKALRDELNLKPGCVFPRVPSLAPPPT